jgi:ribosomal-protein-alanine N-acetyltransferase
MPETVISTARLSLDRLSVVDFDAMWSIHADPLTSEFNPAGPLSNRSDAQRMFGEWIGHWHEHGFGYWTVRDVSGVVGFTGIRFSTWDDRTVLNLSYRYTPSAWGRGYATEGRRPPSSSGGRSTRRIRSWRTRSPAMWARSARP